MFINLQFFGGRGSSSSSSGGGTGGISGADILETRSLISERETQQELVDETLAVFQSVYGEYGAQVEEIQLATLTPGSNALAYYDADDNIAFNEAYFNKETMNAAYAESVRQGYHPSNGSKTALQAVASHELGHKLTADIATKMGYSGFGGLDKASDKILKQALGQTKHKNIASMKGKISGYAKTSSAEAIAEAFADVYCNGKKAKTESRAIVNVIDGYLKGGK